MTNPVTRLNAALEGRYTIERELGEGGMATVYLAEDIKHNRKVALKVLKPELAAVVGAERFLAEIKTTANLQHPHILPLFDSGEADSFLFYVMPYVEGESLRERLNREKQLPIDEAIRVTSEVADALDYAHRRPIIHRDIKPENVLLQDGRVLVADFGIALAVTAGGGRRLTETGLSLGTPAYMSPEQAAGDREVDARTDIYALGCLLYEMLSGEPPHTGSTAQAILANVLTQKPRPLVELRDTVPDYLAAATEKALARLPADRFTTARGLMEALPQAGAHAAAPPARSASYGPPRRLGPVYVALAVSIALGVWGWLRSAAELSSTVTRFQVAVPTGHVMPQGESPNLAISPDGRSIALILENRLNVHSLESGESVPLQGTEGAGIPFFSPEGRWIGFVRASGLHKIPVDGGPVVEISGAVGTDFGAAPIWHETGLVTYTPFGGGAGVWRIHEDGGEPERLDVRIEGALQLAWPQPLGDGRRLLLTVVGPSALWPDTRVVSYDLESHAETVIAERSSFARYIPTGHVLHVDDQGTLFAVPFDVTSGEPTGQRFPVEQGIRNGYWAGGAASYAVSRTGTAVFVRGSNAFNNVHKWVDRAGRELATVGDPVTSGRVRLSPDGDRFITYIYDLDNGDLWLVDATTGARERLTTAPEWEWWGVWSPDGERIAHSVNTESGPAIYIRPSSPGSETTHLTDARGDVWPSSWSADGRWIAFTESSGTDQRNLYAIDVENPGQRLAIYEGPGNAARADFHPSLPLVVYQLDGDLWIASFPDLGDARQLTSDGGTAPLWSPDGDELFYWRDRVLVAQRTGADGQAVGSPESLFEVTGLAEFPEVAYDVAPGGDRSSFTTGEQPAHFTEARIRTWPSRMEKDSSASSVRLKATAWT